jgi:hypothetical protein
MAAAKDLQAKARCVRGSQACVEAHSLLSTLVRLRRIGGPLCVYAEPLTHPSLLLYCGLLRTRRALEAGLRERELKIAKHESDLKDLHGAAQYVPACTHACIDAHMHTEAIPCRDSRAMRRLHP